MTAWYPQDAAPSARRVRKHALAEQVRGLIDDVLMLDVEAASEADLAEAQERLALSRKAFADLPDIREIGPHYSRSDSSLFERSPLSGRSNALAAPLVLEFEGDRTRGHATYPSYYEGPPGLVHGGYVIAAFDDLLGVAQAASGIAGFTGTLTVKLLAGTPLNTRIDYEAGVSSVQGRKIFAWGRSTLEGAVLAEAEGVFIEPRGGHPNRRSLDPR